MDADATDQTRRASSLPTEPGAMTNHDARRDRVNDPVERNVFTYGPEGIERAARALYRETLSDDSPNDDFDYALIPDMQARFREQARRIIAAYESA